MRLEHVNITVNDIEESRRFYTELFGFETRWEGAATGREGPVKAVHLGTGDTYLSLFEAEEDARAPADYSVAGLNHFGLQVEDLAPYRERLAAMGVNLHLDEHYEPGERIYFYDPSGVEIELITYA